MIDPVRYDLYFEVFVGEDRSFFEGVRTQVNQALHDMAPWISQDLLSRCAYLFAHCIMANESHKVTLVVYQYQIQISANDWEIPYPLPNTPYRELFYTFRFTPQMLKPCAHQALFFTVAAIVSEKDHFRILNDIAALVFSKQMFSLTLERPRLSEKHKIALISEPRTDHEEFQFS